MRATIFSGAAGVMLLAALTTDSLAPNLTGASAAAYYISGRNGNDSWSGLRASPNSSNSDGPFQTLARAQAAMRTSSRLKKAILRESTYSISRGMFFDWSDSGEEWLSYSGESAILDGGQTGGISVVGVNSLALEGLTIRDLRAGGIVFNGAKSIILRANHFYNCNRQCISGGAVTNSIIDSNIINGQSPGNPPGDTGTAYSAISLSYGSSGNQLTHNLIENCQGGGIVFAAGPADPANSNNIVDRNILRNVDTNVEDMGAIYLYDKSHSAVGNQITNNVIDGNGGNGYLRNETKAIYLDDAAKNVLVSGNICRSCGQFAWQIHAGDHNTIVNNIFDLSLPGALLGIYQSGTDLKRFGMAGNVFERNIIYFAGAPPSSLYQVNLNTGDALPSGARNLYWSAEGSVRNDQSLFDGSPVYANPEFTQPSSGKYSMPPTSPAYTLIGFKPLPTDQGPAPAVRH